jgi:hypothetical protein
MKKVIAWIVVLCAVAPLSACSRSSETRLSGSPGQPVVVHCTVEVTVLEVEPIEIEDPDHSHRATSLRQVTVRNSNGDVGELVIGQDESAGVGSTLRLCEYQPRNPLPGTVGYSSFFIGTAGPGPAK